MYRKKNKKLRKDLFLDRQTSHGGWPHGENSDWLGRKPVNNIIYQYLEDMGLTVDVPHARLSESKVRKLIKQSLKEAIAAGSTPGEATVTKSISRNEFDRFEYDLNSLITRLIFEDALSIVNSMPKLKMLFDSVDENMSKNPEDEMQTLIQAMSLLGSFVNNKSKNILANHKQVINQKFYEFFLMDFDLQDFTTELKKSLFRNISYFPEFTKYHSAHWDSRIGKGFSSYHNGWENVLFQHIFQNVKEITKDMLKKVGQKAFRERQSGIRASKYNAMMGSPSIQMVNQNQKFANPRPELDKIFFFVGVVELETLDTVFEIDSYDYSDERYRVYEYMSEFQSAALEIFQIPGITSLYSYFDGDYESMCCLCMVGLELGSSSQDQIIKYLKSYADAEYGHAAGGVINPGKGLGILHVSDYKNFRDILLELPPEVVENYISETIYDLNLTEPKEEFVSNLILSDEFVDRVQGDMILQGLQDSNKGLAASVYKMIALKSFDKVKTPKGKEYNFNLEKYKKAVFEFVMDIEDMIADYLNREADSESSTTEILKQLGKIFND